MKRILSLTAVLVLAACGGRNEGSAADTMGASATQTGPAAAPAPMADSLSGQGSAAASPMSGTGASAGASAGATGASTGGTGTGGTGSGSTGS